MNLRILLGFLGLRLCDVLPQNDSLINLGQKKLRAFFANMFMLQCGKNVNIQRKTSFSHLCTIGDNSGIGERAKFYGPVHIGNDVMMGTDCLIYTRNHEFNRLDIVMRDQGPQPIKPVIIGNNVWIGGRVIILPGVHIADGVVVGAGAVVTKNVPENCIVAGNPCRIIRKRGEMSL